MADYEAEVLPDQDWEEEGTANVTPKPPFPSTNTVELPLEHREGGPVTVLRSEYPLGLVIIPNDNHPEGSPADLPMETSSGQSIEISNHFHADWEEGIVALFTN